MSRPNILLLLSDEHSFRFMGHVSDRVCRQAALRTTILGTPHVATGRVDRLRQRIREFRNRRLRGVPITAETLSTGVETRDLELIVFLGCVYAGSFHALAAPFCSLQERFQPQANRAWRVPGLRSWIRWR